jgi:hypothetical protein
MYKVLIPVIIVALVLVSCSSVGMGSNNTNVTSTATIPSTTVMTTLPSETVTIAPDFIYKENDGKVTITEAKSGFSMVIPSEFKQIISFTGEGGQVKFQLYFDFTKAPYNGTHTEDCSSFMSVNLEKDEFKYNPQNDKRPRTLIENPNGQNLLIIDRSQTDQAVEFSFEIEGIPCGGLLSLEKKFYDDHESAILDMLKSIIIAVKN